MRFSSRREKLEWLTNTGKKIGQMELERDKCIMNKDFSHAFSLLKGIKFAKDKFRKVSLTLKK